MSDKHLEATMERNAPKGYDPASDDMTIPFAMKLAEQDKKIAAMGDAINDLARMLEAVRYTTGLGAKQMERIERAKALVRA